MAIFREEFLIALNKWQKGWMEDQEAREQVAEELLYECGLLDGKYKIMTGPCYRKRFIHHGEMVDIFYHDHKPEGLTSWTTDVRYAELFKGLTRENAITAAVFEHFPEPAEVILNICELWKSPEFETELATLQKKDADSCKAIYNFKDIQREVILRAPLRGSEICRLVGKSSSFDDICDAANIPEEERPAAFKRLVDSGALIEEIRYIKDEAARNAVRNTVMKFYDLLAGKK